MTTIVETKKNHIGKIKRISLDEETKHRLGELGIHKNSKVKIIQNEKGFPLILEVKGSRIAIGKKECQQIYIE